MHRYEMLYFYHHIQEWLEQSLGTSLPGFFSECLGKLLLVLHCKPSLEYKNTELPGDHVKITNKLLTFETV